jgi:uncharacterized membrane protein
MQPTILAAIIALSGPPAYSMAFAGLALFVIGLLAAKNDIAQARGIGKVVALTPLCFAIPLAIFGAEHLSNPQALVGAVPAYMPWRMLWVYFVGLALIAAALSIAVKRQVRWSALLFGSMMILFVAMLHFPGALSAGGRIPWTIVFREMSFGGGAWVLAGIAMGGERAGPGKTLVTVGRVPIAIAAIFFGAQHFLHPLGIPGVPLVKETPLWVPARAYVDYVTGAFLIAAGLCFLLAWKTRIAASYLGAWIVFLVVAIYIPVMIGALMNPNSGVEIEGVNYFADTLLFGGVILSQAATSRNVGSFAKLDDDAPPAQMNASATIPS